MLTENLYTEMRRIVTRAFLNTTCVLSLNYGAPTTVPSAASLHRSKEVAKLYQIHQPCRHRKI